MKAAALKRSFAAHKLHQFADGHAARIAVRIHDEIRANAVGVEWHIFLRTQIAADAFLSVSTAELVAELWTSENRLLACVQAAAKRFARLTALV